MGIILDESSRNLLDEHGFNILDEMTAPPPTLWVGDQQQEYTLSGDNDIADSSRFMLADLSGNLITDNGITESDEPDTEWT